MTSLTTTTAKRALIYARYSTDRQTPKSIADQIAEATALCAQQSWRIVGTEWDEEVSGFTDHRAGFERVKHAIRAGEIDVLVAENGERLSRDTEHTAQLQKLCRFHDVTIHTIVDGESSELVLGIKALMSAELLRSIARQTHRGLQGNIGEGRSAGGLSYGYRIPIGADGLRQVGHLVIDDAEAAIVCRIMTEYADGRRPHEIAARLNAEGIASPGGKYWKQNTIYGNSARGTGILNNELYVGVRVWNRLEYRRNPESRKRVSRLRPQSAWVYAEVPNLAIVDDALWDRVKARQLSNAKKKSKTQEGKRALPRPSQFLLSGLLECGCCGGKMTIAGSGRKYYYCQNAKEKGHAVCTGMKGLRQEETEKAVLAGLKRDLLRPEAVEAFRAEYERAVKAASGDLDAERTALTKRLRKTEKEIENGTRAIMAGVMSEAILTALKAAEERKASLVAELASLDRPTVTIPADLSAQYQGVVARLESVLSSPGLIAQAIDIVRSLIERIVVVEREEGGHEVTIEGSLQRLLRASTPAAFAGGASDRLFAGFGCGSRI